MQGQSIQINFWDVGQGDCSTITLPDGRLIIIDTGPRGSPLIDWLNDRPRNIHSVVLTHNDADHVGALPALVGQFMSRIHSFFMLVDRPANDSVFNKIFRCALEGESKGYYQISRLETGAIVWRDAGLHGELIPIFPRMSANVLATSPNAASGILALRFNGRTAILWPGDSSLGRLSDECAGTKPYVMVGPHHGAPEGYKRSAAVTQIEAVNPSNAYISVATKNKYSHPRPKYIQRLERAGCHVVCSELTGFCDRNSVKNHKPVMSSHLVLGLRPPRFKSAVACRGPWQLTWDGDEFISDGLDEEHLSRVSNLRRPQCLRGREYFHLAMASQRAGS
jgi:competence protein ComEC